MVWMARAKEIAETRPTNVRTMTAGGRGARRDTAENHKCLEAIDTTSAILGVLCVSALKNYY